MSVAVIEGYSATQNPVIFRVIYKTTNDLCGRRSKRKAESTREIIDEVWQVASAAWI